MSRFSKRDPETGMTIWRRCDEPGCRKPIELLSTTGFCFLHSAAGRKFIPVPVQPKEAPDKEIANAEKYCTARNPHDGVSCMKYAANGATKCTLHGGINPAGRRLSKGRGFLVPAFLHEIVDAAAILLDEEEANAEPTL